MKQYILALDAGHTSVKSVLFDTEGNEIATSTAQNEREKIADRGAGFEEFSVINIWESAKTCIQEAIKQSGIDSKDIVAAGITSFGNGITVIDKDGNPCAPGAVSQDYRANSIVAEYKKSGALDKINDIIKGSLFAGEPAPLLRWFKDNEPETYAKIDCAMMLKDYLIYKLTGEKATDINIFGGSAMLDVTTVNYSKELMDLYGIPEMYDKLPKLMNCSDLAGKVHAEAAKETGIPEGTPIATGMMDILACLVGAGASDEGIATMVAGSWCINETMINEIRLGEGIDANQPALDKGLVLNCSYTGASATNFEWFNKTLGGTAIMEAEKAGTTKYKFIDDLLNSMGPDKTDVLFLPFVAQPSVHPNAKAEFFNIDMNTEYKEIAYALAEGIVFMHRRHMEFIINAGSPINLVRLTGGIARSAVWGQLFADVLQKPVEVVESEEVGALGIAITSGIAAGVYSSYEDGFKKAVRMRARYEPRMERAAAFNKRYAEWQGLIDLMMPYWENK